ncbi:SDR family NAD(P)-dependent oxidoreductase [Candidatus Amarobacter glycogenicus]|uniref:SDR family NAD(P)-dependent oxidoreductase n=1 Tax=Candidatus Amarobacter glycogenicus TaxID=3140699 RepID=UPI003134BCCA|nr:SDR family NAD(P)-dependent oxidoreductase [Dehalococcoidia bacterium]
MKDFKDKVAVVTGAASGMGLAFAHKFAEEGMSVVLADIEAEALSMAEAAVKAHGGKVAALRTNVIVQDDIERLADAAFNTFGNVHILCNNAGVIASAATFRSRPWETPLGDWEWTWGVNFMGVLHGIRSFVPRMLENGEEGHIVNTASMAGLLAGADPYTISKHSVVSLTEGIYKEFKGMGAKLSASVLCPGLIKTAILEAERNRPPEFGPATAAAELRPEVQQFSAFFKAALDQGIDPEQVAQLVFEAIRDDQFYIFPAQPNILESVHVRLNDILNQRNPTLGP